MSTDQSILQINPPIPVIQLARPPAEITNAVTTLRIACAKLAPNFGTSDHKIEVQACDVVLGRDLNYPFGVFHGVTFTIVVFGIWMILTASVRGIRQILRERRGRPA